MRTLRRSLRTQAAESGIHVLGAAGHAGPVHVAGMTEQVFRSNQQSTLAAASEHALRWEQIASQPS